MLQEATGSLQTIEQEPRNQLELLVDEAIYSVSKKIPRPAKALRKFAGRKPYSTRVLALLIPTAS
jgi:hypothetical protein